MKEERLYLVGYMASGKTTLGHAIAEAWGAQFVDLDEEVERREGIPVKDFILERGEEAFRRAESMALKATAGLKRAVIACGGGTPCWRDNMEFMTLHGMTAWLVASPETLARRILEAGPTRPLAKGKTPEELTEFVRKHLLERQPYYCRAEMRINTENLENDSHTR